MSREISKNLREFAARGNLFVTAAALLLALTVYFFLQSIVEGLIGPAFAAVFGEPGLYALSFTVNNGEFAYGIVLTHLILLVVAVALVFSLAAALQAVRPRPDEAVRSETDAPAP